MNEAVNYAHDGTYLLGYGSAGGAVFPQGSMVEPGYPPGWPLPQCPSAQHRWNIHTRQWEAMPLAADEVYAQVRYRRDQLLSETDWMMLRAAETGVPVEQVWLDYRQALRDITEQPDPAAIVWPEQPRE